MLCVSRSVATRRLNCHQFRRVVLLLAALVVTCAIGLVGAAVPSKDDPHDVSSTVSRDHDRHDGTTTFVETRDDHRHDDTTPGPGASTPDAPSSSRRGKGRKSAPLNVESSTWGWVPIVVVVVFSIFMFMGRKFESLDNTSLRLWLIQYISIETLYKTLAGATHHEYMEQRMVEIGHQVFVVVGVIFLAVSFGVNEALDNPQRYSFYVLQLVQMGLLLFNVIFDLIMIRRGHLRSVRSLNTKLRFAHCTYQVFLFCTDVLSTGVTALPVDCYIWATIHYSYESVGLLLEGLNVIGMSDIAIITLVNARAMSNTIESSGAVCAFGMTCLILSCVSIVGGILWKSIDATKHKPFNHDDHDTGDENYVDGPPSDAATKGRSSSGAGPRTADTEMTSTTNGMSSRNHHP